MFVVASSNSNLGHNSGTLSEQIKAYKLAVMSCTIDLNLRATPATSPVAKTQAQTQPQITAALESMEQAIEGPVFRPLLLRHPSSTLGFYS